MVLPNTVNNNGCNEFVLSSLFDCFLLLYFENEKALFNVDNLQAKSWKFFLFY